MTSDEVRLLAAERKLASLEHEYSALVREARHLDQRIRDVWSIPLGGFRRKPESETLDLILPETVPVVIPLVDLVIPEVPRKYGGPDLDVPLILDHTGDLPVWDTGRRPGLPWRPLSPCAMPGNEPTTPEYSIRVAPSAAPDDAIGGIVVSIWHGDDQGGELWAEADYYRVEIHSEPPDLLDVLVGLTLNNQCWISLWRIVQPAT